MWKEVIISIIIVMTIVALDNVSHGYATYAIDSTSKELEDLKNEIMKKDDEENENNNIIDEICSKWEERQKKLAYFIEHDELEKVQTNLTSIKSYIQLGETTDAINDLDKNVYILDHIKEKYDFNLQNIF